MARKLVYLNPRCNNCIDFDVCGQNKVACEDWCCNDEYEKKIIDKSPWYLRQQYYWGNSDIDDIIEAIEVANTGGNILVNLYCVIMHTLKINEFELSEMLGVKRKVLLTEIEKGGESRYIESFSERLNIPVKFFEKTTHRDIEEIEKLLLQNFEVKTKKKTKNKKKKRKK